jgi:DNA mismatch repair ATPase MutS
MLRRIESEPWQTPYLKQLRASLDVRGVSPSTYMTRLARYEGFAQLRTQGPVYFVLNIFTMWDFWCLERIERFASEVGPEAERWFETVGEVEMLCSLSTLRHGDPSTTYPEISDENVGFVASALAHPLLAPHARITNDVALEGKGSLLVITGSNMAGKSTLLRAVGLNVALALAGGPVCAQALRLCPVRLRASMRIDDSLQRGASYFHAELGKLRMVVDDLEHGPPVLFLLDELLRGTNARARNTGARSVLLHLISRGALGLVATHDVGLSALESELTKVHNVHFTDVFEDGEMRFDYKLRPGPVTTSNALRLLAMAGIEVPTDDRVA